MPADTKAPQLRKKCSLRHSVSVCRSLIDWLKKGGMYPEDLSAHNPTSRGIIAVVNHRSRSTIDVGERFILNLISTSNIWRLQNTFEIHCVYCVRSYSARSRASETVRHRGRMLKGFRVADNQTKVTSTLRHVKDRGRKSGPWNTGSIFLLPFLVHSLTEALLSGKHRTKTKEPNTFNHFQICCRFMR